MEVVMEDKRKWQLITVVIVILTLVAIAQTIILFKLSHESRKPLAIEATTQSRAGAPQFPAYLRPIAQPQNRRSAQAYGAHPRSFIDAWDWDPFQEMDQMQQRMNRLMGRMLQSYDDWNNSSGETLEKVGFSPSADLEDVGDKWVVHFDVPGLEKDKINVEVQNGILTVRGERKSERKSEDQTKGFYSSEIQYGFFSRSLALPASADESKVDASYDKGVLTITIGKKSESEQAANQKVVVK